MELKENERLVHIFKYGNKNIPLSYDVIKIEDRLQEVTKVIEYFLSYINEVNDCFSEKDKKLLMAEEVISSSFIEGYDTYLSPDFIVRGVSSGSLADKATLSGYSAYVYAFSKNDDILNVDNIVDIWKKLVKYKRFFRKNIRITGVRVGSKLHTVHKAPDAKYVRSLLDDMFQTLLSYKKEKEDKYDLIRGILFHYIFTFIHPFLDGNGRLSRLLANKILIDNGLEKFKYISLNSEIIKQKNAYNLQLQSVENSNSNDLTNYIKFMLNLFYVLLSRISNPRRKELDYSTLNDRQKIMLNCIKASNRGIYVKQYKQYWNVIAKEKNYSKITILDAEKDLIDLFEKGFIIVDERYVLYPGFKYYNE